MQRIEIRRGAKVRVVYSPSPHRRRRLLDLLPTIAQAERDSAKAAGVWSVAHGFVAGRSPVTAAILHRGYAVTVSCDLRGWFDSVRGDQLPLSADVLREVLHEGAPRQGLPTSPACCNLAAVPMDAAIVRQLGSLPCKTAYTRYADDLTVSVSDERYAERVLEILTAAACAMGWEIHPAKTRVQYARAGRRVVLGVSVNDDVRPTRETKRRLRAARHQNNETQARGLAEWARCRLPRAARTGRQGLSGLGATAQVPSAKQPITTTAITTSTRRLTM